MKGVSRSPARRNDAFYRYLKPGALAQIRNSRINARSGSFLTRSLVRRMESPMPESPSETSQFSTIDQVPNFVTKSYGPYCIRRKKLVASRSISLLNLNAFSNSVLEPGGGNNNAVNNDAVIAH